MEYGLIAAGTSIAIITAVQTVGTSLTATFTGVSNALAG
jgi:pilus assembly protein Flp/PilA